MAGRVNRRGRWPHERTPYAASTPPPTGLPICAPLLLQVYLWDQEALRQRCLLGHPDEPLTCCSVSLDDMYVVCGGARGTIYTWDSDK